MTMLLYFMKTPSCSFLILISFNFSIFGRSYDRWPIFNIADAAVSIGVLILLFFYKRHEAEDKKTEEETGKIIDSTGLENIDSMNNPSQKFQ